MSSTRRRRTGIRTAAVAAVLAATAALAGTPAAHAQSAGTVRLTAAQLAQLSARYTPRADGTPGLVAAAAEASGGSDSSASTSTATTAAGSTATGAATDSASGTSSVQQQASWETARGAASTLALGGTGDWVSVFSGGTVARYDAAGKPVWQRTSHSLYQDWQVKSTTWYLPEEFTPVLYEGYDPYQPSSTGTHPYAQADFNHDGVDDIAVAYEVGTSPVRPFTSPGSDLSSGT